MPIDVRIPTLGESVSEGVIVRWIKAEGAAVQMDEPLLELETDKASVEIPATEAGVLKIVKAEGTTVQVGDVVARIETGAVQAKAAAPKPAEPTAPPPEPSPAAPEPAAPPAGILSPAVRRLVEEHGLDAHTIKASGRGG